jgi:AhpD family alkylhydroperoxidase
MTLALFVSVAACAAGFSQGFAQQPTRVSVAALAAQASREVTAAARIPLIPETSDLLRAIPTLEAAGSRRVPNYLRAFAAIPESVPAYATAFQTLLFGGTVEPETKMAMGLQVGRVLRSPYAVVHMQRLLRATDRGRLLLRHVESGTGVKPEQELAVRYAEWLTEDVHGVNPERFRQVRGYYTDAQIVELTLVVSFFNYFTRFVEAVNLPVEPWALDTVIEAPRITREPSLARVSLISDTQLEWAANTVASRRQSANQGDERGFGLVNSERAMNLVPDIASAWRAFTGTLGAGAAVEREIKLHVSFAVSMANGCRYCTLHQVQGLRRLGVNPGKLIQMQKDDSALTPRELTAVIFARKLTRDPLTITDGDYDHLRAEFGEKGAVEVVLQTCTFAFMNRFTDNLGLPSEDEAIRVYREVYGTDWK